MHLDTGSGNSMTPFLESHEIVSLSYTYTESCVPIQVAESSNTIASTSEEKQWPKVYTLPGFEIPQSQMAAMTPLMGKSINIQNVETSIQSLGSGDVVVRIGWTGICRSDVCFSLGPEPGYPTHNHIAGHEGIGHIVQSYDLTLLGRPVAIRWLGSSCQSCFYCLRNTPESCKYQKIFPKHHNGTFQQYMTAPWTSLMPLPKWVFDTSSGIDPATYTAALCSGSAALKALRSANVQPNDVVVIVGIFGAIGHLAGLLAKQVFKAQVIGLDWSPKEGAFGSEAHKIYDGFLPVPMSSSEALQQDFQKQLQEMCYDLRGERILADAVICTASTSAGLENLPDYVRDGGSIVCVGAPRGNVPFTIPLLSVVERQLRISGTLMGGRDEAYQMLEYIRSGKVQPFLTQVRLESVGDSMHKSLKDETVGKVVCRVNGPLTRVK